MEHSKSDRRELPRMVTRVNVNLHSKTQISFEQALQELGNSVPNAKDVLLNSTEDDPLTTKNILYWI